MGRGGAALRVLSFRAGGAGRTAMVDLVRSLEPDAVVIHGGPRRLRWRTRCADLANRYGLVYAEGGEPALGNVIFVNLRVGLDDTWCVQFPLTAGRLMCGAAVVRGSVVGRRFVLAGTQLAQHADERPAQAAIMSRELADVGAPVVLAADVADAPTSPAWRALAAGRLDVDPVAAADGGPAVLVRHSAILVDPRVVVTGCRVVPLPRRQADPDSSAVLADLEIPG